MKMITLLAALCLSAPGWLQAETTSSSAEDFSWFYQEFRVLQTFFDDPLMYAADRGYTEVVQHLLNELPEGERQEAIVAEDKEGWTLLMEAAQSGSAELTEYLIQQVSPAKRSAYILHKAYDGTTALMAAAMAEEDAPEASQALLAFLTEEIRSEYLADTRRNNAHALIIAIVNRHEVLAEYLIQAMPKEHLTDYLFVQDDRGRSALIWTAVTGLHHTAEALIEALPENKREEYISLETPYGWTVMDHADARMTKYLHTVLSSLSL